MARLTINFADDIKFARDLNEVAKAWGFEDAFAIDPTLTKQDFVENKIKENFKYISKQSRTQKAVQQITVDD
jgi:hypothetical protein